MRISALVSLSLNPISRCSTVKVTGFGFFILLFQIDKGVEFVRKCSKLFVWNNSFWTPDLGQKEAMRTAKRQQSSPCKSLENWTEALSCQHARDTVFHAVFEGQDWFTKRKDAPRKERYKQINKIKAYTCEIEEVEGKGKAGLLFEKIE